MSLAAVSLKGFGSRPALFRGSCIHAAVSKGAAAGYWQASDTRIVETVFRKWAGTLLPPPRASIINVSLKAVLAFAASRYLVVSECGVEHVSQHFY